MKRNYQLDTTAPIASHDLIKQIAFHEAGHAAGIYLYNKQQGLPSVFFQITQTADKLVNLPDASLRDCFVAGVEGGYLIDNLPVTLLESACYFSATVQDAYQAAFEADMINLLVGALAEAKHVALREGEYFNVNKAGISTLRFYGGTSDLDKVFDYLERFIAGREKREDKMIGLLAKAVAFLDNVGHWQAIERLAAFILDSKESAISCEEAIAVLDRPY
ncbi:MAG: hypothetical protein Q7U57_03955 [Methylovulum sp.]|nr:hypothetical protein [Methylovulum sp.]